MKASPAPKKLNPGFGKNVIVEKSLMALLSGAKSSGSITYTNRNATIIPQEILNFGTITLPDTKWWEEVPLTKLDLSNNQIDKIPKLISQNQDLIVLRVANNFLTLIEDEAFLLPTLKLLDLSSNKLQNIPNSLGQLSSLVELNLTSNFINKLPDCFSKLANIEIAQLSKNKLTFLPPSFFLCSKLKILDLSENNFISLQFELSKFMCLETLIAKKNAIRDIAENSISFLKCLKFLDLSDNKLIEFSEFPKNITSDTIILSGNQLTKLRNVENSASLTVLNFHSNKIKLFPSSILKLQHLKTLDVSNNDIDDLPFELGLMKSLVRLSLEGNPLRKIRSSIRQSNTEILKEYLASRIVEEEKAQNAGGIQIFENKSSNEFIRKAFISGEELSFRSFKINELPKEILTYQEVKKINLEDNMFVSAPEELFYLANIKVVNLAKNKIKALHAGILNAGKIEDLNISNNDICELFQVESVNSYESKIQFLNISINKLNICPTIISFLPKLRSLDISYNSIQTLSNLFEAQKPFLMLEHLNVSNNRLVEICPEIGRIKSLRQLIVENNDLKDLPNELGSLELSLLKFSGNPMRILKKYFTEQPIKVLAYLKNRALN